MKIVLYRKSGCPWSAAVMGFLNELNIPYEIKNVTTNPAYAKEVEAASGQDKSPTLDIDGTILPDASVEDVAKALQKEGWLFKRGSKPVTSLLNFFQFLHPDRSRAANRKMHQINLGVIDLRLPTPVAFSSPVKFVEGNFPDKANHARLTSPNDS